MSHQNDWRERMSSRIFRNLGIGLLVVLVGVAVYLQRADSHAEATGPTGKAPADGKVGKKNAVAGDAGNRAEPVESSSAASTLTAEEQERITTAMKQYQWCLQQLERANAEVKVSRDYANGGHFAV